jgi:hypothetical protein
MPPGIVMVAYVGLGGLPASLLASFLPRIARVVIAIVLAICTALIAVFGAVAYYAAGAPSLAAFAPMFIIAAAGVYFFIPPRRKAKVIS